MTSRESVLSPSHSHGNSNVNGNGGGASGSSIIDSNHGNIGVANQSSLSPLSYDRDNGKYDVHNHRVASQSQWVSLGIALIAVVSFTMVVFFLVHPYTRILISYPTIPYQLCYGRCY